MSQQDRQQRISLIVCYVLFGIASLIIISGRYYSRSQALKQIPRTSVPISNNEVPHRMAMHIRTQWLNSMETRATPPALDADRMPAGWELRGNKVYVETRKACLEAFARWRDLIESRCPRVELSRTSTDRHFDLLKETSQLDASTADRLADIYKRARYSHHTLSSADVKFVWASLRSFGNDGTSTSDGGRRVCRQERGSTAAGDDAATT
jgi:hypothetical protein